MGEMQDKSDAQLLREYVQNGDEAAFTELVGRHTNLVYSAAARQVESPDMAADIAHRVFIGLVRGAKPLIPKLAETASLAGWLCRSARNLALNLRRDEFRRHFRERQAMEQLNIISDPAPDWDSLRPVLDEAMSKLDETDYDALVMRFYNNQSLREVGLAQGVSDDTAQKRVSRALDKLREQLSRRGISTTAGAISLALAANAVQAAPPGLAAAISTAALAGAAVTTSTIIATTTKAIVMTTLQKAAVTASLAILAGAGIYEAAQNSKLRDQIQTIQEDQASKSARMSVLESANADLSNQVARTKIAQAMSKSEFNELLKLRGQATQAQAVSRELAKLKSNGGNQSNGMPDYMTNAMAFGMGAAEKFALKAAKSKVDRMGKALNLTDDQKQSIMGIMQQHIKSQSQMTIDLMGGKLTGDQFQSIGQDKAAEQTDIQSVLTPDQAAAYPDFLKSEVAFAADKAAGSDASQLAESYNLSRDQEDQIHAAFYQLSMNPVTDGLSEDAINAAKKNGDIAGAMNKSIDLQKAQLEQKTKILGDYLTPDQVNSYRDDQMSMINMQAAVLKMFPKLQAANASN
jgi:RNA polymerase sigma factor (sigma-70 family)